MSFCKKYLEKIQGGGSTFGKDSALGFGGWGLMLLGMDTISHMNIELRLRKLYT